MQAQNSISVFTLLSNKGQVTLKANCKDVNSSKKQMNEFVFTLRRVFVHFLEEIEDTKNTFRNYLTFNKLQVFLIHFEKILA